MLQCGDCSDISDNMQVALNDANRSMHEQIQMFLKADAIRPYRFDQVDIDSLIPQINCTLRTAIRFITQSVSERRGKGKVNDSTSRQNVKLYDNISVCVC